MKQLVKNVALQMLFHTRFGKNLQHGIMLHPYYANFDKNISRRQFLLNNIRKFHLEAPKRSKAKQIASLLNKVELLPVENDSFYYSIDCFKTLELRYPIFDNYSVDYTRIVCSSLKDIQKELGSGKGAFEEEELCVIDAMNAYLQRMKKDTVISEKFSLQIEEIESLFYRPAQSFREALQRILFFNQFLWQTRHKHNGFGHLDWLLNDLYEADLAEGKLTREQAKKLILDFFDVLHANCWFKSTLLVGDTGQIIILGGLTAPSTYKCNDLTYLFIEANMDAGLPDPKVLLRCSTHMPDDLLKLALDCIATGVGAPFLSNDDAVIPKLIAYGYSEECSHNYATAACWEPLILNVSADQNNISTLNFAQPLNDMFAAEDLSMFDKFEDVLEAYEKYLAAYIAQELKRLSELEFEPAPLLSMLSGSALMKRKDLVRGGAEYSNLGLTSVAISCVVNSMLNIRRFVFEDKKFTIQELNAARTGNFENAEDTVALLKANPQRYGSDDPDVWALTNRITEFTSREFERYNTKYGGKFKFGLSAPGYVTLGSCTAATFDGRRNGEPFNVHISADGNTAATELISFACKLDYSENRINGNVVDLMTSPHFLRENMEKFMLLLKAGFANGLYQMQMNVLDSATIIAARENPEAFPNLVVRVWGFSAYFKDLPVEYQDLLVQRALQSEAAHSGR